MTASSIIEIPPEVQKIADEARNRLLISCTCGARFRVKAELAGKTIRCPKCSQPLAVPAAQTAATAAPAAAAAPSADAPPSSISGRFLRATAPVTRSMAELAAEIESQPPKMESPPALKEKLSGGRFKKFAVAIEKKSSEGKPEAEQRRKSILEFAATGDARVAASLAPLISDYWVPVRDAVAEALGNVGDPAGVPLLIRLLADESPEVRRDAIVSLAKIGDARAVRALLTLALQEPLLRFSASEAVTRIGKAAVPVLVQLVKDDDAGLGLEATIALGRIKDASAVEPISALLNHPFGIMRSHAAEVLGQLGDAKATPALLKAITDRDAIVRANAAVALQRVGDKRSVPALVKLLGDPDLDVVIKSTTALGELGDPQAATAIIPLLERSEPELRAAAADALGKLANEVAAAPLTARFHDDDENVRLKAVSAFRKFRSAQAVAPLLLMLDDGNVIIRQRAVDALGEIGNTAAVERLMTTLRTDSATEVRMSAAKALGQLKSPKALPVLEDALDDEFTVRCKAITALGDIGDASSLPALLAMLKDPTPEIRYHASQALGDIGHQNSMRSIEELLADQNPMVRRGAAKALIKLGDPRGEKLLQQASAGRKLSVSQRVNELVPDWLVGLGPSASSPAFLLGVPVVLAVLAGGWFAGTWLLASAFTPKTLTLSGKVLNVSMSPDGKHVAVGRTRGMVQTFDTTTLKQVAVINTMSGQPARSILGADGKTVYVVAGPVLTKYEGSKATPLTAHQSDIRLIWATPSRKVAVSVDANKVAYLWDLEAGTVKQSLQVDVAEIVAIAVNEDASRLAWAEGNGTIALFNVTDGKVDFTWRIPKGRPAEALALSSDGGMAAAAHYDGGLMVWDATTGKPLASVPSKDVQGMFYRHLFFKEEADKPALVAVKAATADELDIAAGTVRELATLTGAPFESVEINFATSKMVCGSVELNDPIMFDLTNGAQQVLLGN